MKNSVCLLTCVCLCMCKSVCLFVFLLSVQANECVVMFAVQYAEAI